MIADEPKWVETGRVLSRFAFARRWNRSIDRRGFSSPHRGRARRLRPVSSSFVLRASHPLSRFENPHPRVGRYGSGQPGSHGERSGDRPRGRRTGRVRTPGSDVATDGRRDGRISVDDATRRTVRRPIGRPIDRSVDPIIRSFGGFSWICSKS